MFSRAVVVGQIQNVKFRVSGSAMIFVKSSPIKEAPVGGSPLPLFFSPIVNIRIPKRVAEAHKKFLKIGEYVSLDCTIQGMRRPIGGDDTYYNETVANTVFPLKVQDFDTAPLPEDHEDFKEELEGETEELKEMVNG